jgi:1,4-dihydroxy-2-naphthoate octaprenyltransferase
MKTKIIIWLTIMLLSVSAVIACFCWPPESIIIVSGGMIVICFVVLFTRSANEENEETD